MLIHYLLFIYYVNRTKMHEKLYKNDTKKRKKTKNIQKTPKTPMKSKCSSKKSRCYHRNHILHPIRTCLIGYHMV